MSMRNQPSRAHPAGLSGLLGCPLKQLQRSLCRGVRLRCGERDGQFRVDHFAMPGPTACSSSRHGSALKARNANQNRKSQMSTVKIDWQPESEDLARAKDMVR